MQQDVPIFSEWVGTTDGFVNAEVRPRVQGYLLEQDYKDGSFVQAGQLLFEIDDRPYRAALAETRGTLAQQQANLEKYRRDVARYRPLAAEGAVSRQELEDATAAMNAAQAQVEAAQAAREAAELNLEWTKVYAAIDGVAGIASAQVGDLVTPTTVLTVVSDVDPIKVSFPISEREYLRFAARIKQHEATGHVEDEVDLELVLANGEHYPHPGHFYVANRQVDPQTGTIQVQALFPNPGGILRPGLYARVRARTELRRGALLVPQRAVQETQGVYQVAVVGADDTVDLRTVKPGPQVDGQWILESGVTAGERVVVEGLQKVRAGLKVQPKPAPVEAGTTTTTLPGRG